jgi:hypothetical protein
MARPNMLERLGDFLLGMFRRKEQVNRDPKQMQVKRVGLAVVKNSSSGSGKNYDSSDFDLNTIQTAYDTDSYVRAAVDKYVDLIFKEGWQFKGKNQQSLTYIQTRLAVMAESTSQDNDSFFQEIADSVVKFSNSFTVKARLKENLPIPGLRFQGLNGNLPIGGYFNLTPPSMQIARDKNGNVTSYQQKATSSGAKDQKFKTDDVVHITWKKPLGKAFGVPFLQPVIEDIRLLREIEDNVSNLLYKYLHPLYKFIVGTDKPGSESTPEEIEFVKNMIADMSSDGTLVLPERYDVEVVGAQGSALDASWALKYFEQRVFTGLGVPETVFGRASTANKSTADNLTAEMHDRVKAFQKVIANNINFWIIKELLYEGGYDPLTKPDDNVELVFNEIAIDEKIKSQNHTIYKFEHNVATFEETRHELGMEPEVDESRLFMNMITIPVAQATADAKAAASTGTADANNKNKPQNQHGTKVSPKKTTSYDGKIISEAVMPTNARSFSSGLKNYFESYKNDVINHIRSDKVDQLGLIASVVKEKMLNQSRSFLTISLLAGVTDVRKDCQVSRNPEVAYSIVLRQMLQLIESDINRLFADMERLINQATGKEKMTDKLLAVSASFESNRFRLEFMAKSRLYKTYNYGYSLAAMALGRTELEVVVKGGCKDCRDKAMTKITLANNQSLLSILPPWHANCACNVKVSR